MNTLKMSHSIFFISMFLFLVSCSSSQHENNSADVVGRAIDGYIKDATVCLDINDNGRCDSDEPTTISDTNGTFILKTDGSYSGSYTIIVKGGTDTATNEQFLGTLTNSVSLEENLTEVVTHVTPLTTLAVSVAKNENLTMEDAKERVAQTFGLTKEDIDVDPMTNSKVFVQTQIVVQTTKKIVDTMVSNESSINLNDSFNLVMQKIAEQVSETPQEESFNIGDVVTKVSEATSVAITQDQVEELNTSINSIKEKLEDDVSNKNFDDIQKEVDVVISVDTNSSGLDLNITNKSNTTVDLNITKESNVTQELNVTQESNTVTINHLPIFTSANSVTVDENSLSVMQVHAIDADGDTLTYSLSGADASAFSIDSITGQLRFKVAPDYETNKHTYSVDVSVSDGVSTTTEKLTINIKNINDNLPVFTSGNSVTVDENSLSVMQVHAIDADGDTLTYSLSGADASAFSIDSITGQLRFKVAPDYETNKHTYSVDVSVSDGVHNVLQKVIVNIHNIYEAPLLDLDTNTTGRDYSAIFTENTEGVAIVGNIVIKVEDNDPLESATITLTNPQNNDDFNTSLVPSTFTIEKTSTNEEMVLTLTAETSASDYEEALQDIKFFNTSDNPSIEQRHFEISVNDGLLDSLIAMSNIDIEAVNDSPVLEDANLSVKFNLSLNDIRNSLTINMLDYISDPDSDLNLSSFQIVTEPLKGDVSCEDLICTYTPQLDYDSNDSFSYSIADIEGARSTQSIRLYVEKYGALRLVVNVLTFTIPVDDDYEYKYNIDCDSDGEYDEENITGEYTCNIDSNDSEHKISIYGKFPHLTFQDANCSGLVSIDDWGVVSFDDFSYTFYGCKDFDSTKDTNGTPNLSNVVSMHSAFESSNFNYNIEDWNVSHVEDMERMFYDNTTFNQPLNKWDVSHVTSMVKMFETNSPSSFNQPLGDWNVSNVEKMSFMFQGAADFNQSLENWDISSVTAIDSMFQYATSFNQPLNSWDVSNVKYMDHMFHGATSFNQPLNNWDVSNVYYMISMFQDATDFNQSIENWDTSNVTLMDSMFQDASSFSDHDLSDWNVSNITSHDDFMLDAGPRNIEPNWP